MKKFIILPNFFIKSVGVLSLLTLSISAAYACTLPKSDFKNLECTATADMFVAFKDNGLPVALVNKSGKKVADLFGYDEVLTSQFRSGLMPVKRGGKVGYINRQGRLVIPTIYDNLGGNQWAKGVAGGRIGVRQNGKWLVLDTNGRNVGGLPNDTIKLDKTEVAKTMPKPKTEPTTKTNNQTKSAPKQTITKTTPKPLPHHQNPTWADDNFFAHKQGDKWGYVNRAGTPMIVYAFDEAAPFSEGLAGVKMGDKWGFITPAGDLVIDFRFDNKGITIMSRDVPDLVAPFVFKNGRAWVGNLKDGKKLCIDKLGKNVDCQTGQLLDTPNAPTATPTSPQPNNLSDTKSDGQPNPSNTANQNSTPNTASNALINTLEQLPIILPTSDKQTTPPNAPPSQ